MNILIPIETASRETPYKVFLSSLLSKRGFKCYIGTKTSINNLIENSESFIYLDKGFHNGVSQKYYHTIKKNNGIIYSLDEEGAVDYADNRILKHRYSRELFNFADHVFFWGKRQHDVVEGNINDSRKTSVSGHPRFQLLSSNFHEIYQSDVKKLTETYGQYVLFNTNMSFGNNINGDEFILKNYGDRFDNLDKIIAFDKEKCVLISKCIRQIASLSAYKVILRPHPEEELSFYTKQFKDLPNVVVIYEGSVVPWILGSEYVVHPDCTTAIEAVFLGKKAFSILPKEHDQTIVTSLPLEVSFKLDSELDINIQINHELKSKDISTELKEVLESNFSIHIDSFSHIVDQFDKIYDPKADNIRNTVILKQIIKNRIKDIYNNIAPKSLRRENKLSKNKTKELTVYWIKELLSAFTRVDESLINVEVIKIHKELFLIKNK
jgi:surface carbohydrate biosynthesis protein